MTNHKNTTSPMSWQRLLTTCRLGQEMRHLERRDDRSEFKRDYDRLVFSAPFRRLQNKTQVFPLPGSVFVHNRLTHSLEVASVGMSLGNDVAKGILLRDDSLKGSMLSEIGTIVSAACLAHDMGNPPFGHSGEKAIQTFFTEGYGQSLRPLVSEGCWQDVTHFEGNANAFRLLTHRFLGRRDGGFVMTYPTLAAIVKYPFSSTLSALGHGKFGFFSEEASTYRKIADEMGIFCISDEENALHYARHPLVFLVEAADDICYEIMDIEDSYKLRILSFEETKELLLGFFPQEAQRSIERRIESEGITDKNEQIIYMRASAIGILENACADVFLEHEQEILAGRYHSSLIKGIKEPLLEAYRRCEKVSWDLIYKSKPVLDVELSGYKIMETLMEVMTEAALHPERYYSKQLISRVSRQYDITSPIMENRIMAVLDYISGMTDVYALDVYQKIKGISLPIV